LPTIIMPLRCMGSSHDETGASVTDPSQTREVMQQAIEWTNKDLKCHVTFAIDSNEGENYGQVH